jgi:ubiquinone/menaquinone biosynthesis C-methylase UbiE
MKMSATKWRDRQTHQSARSRVGMTNCSHAKQTNVNPQGAVDTINRLTMRSAVHEYLWTDELETHERAALASVIDTVRGKRILDLGVGAGRTVKGLRAISEDYVGVDYVQEMVDHCRNRFPAVRFETGDARSLPVFADASFDLIVFACNGICMVDHQGRLEIVNEAYRLLAPGGYFIFSMNNRDWPRHNEFLALPGFVPSSNPLKLAVRTTRFVAQTVYRLNNRMLNKRHEVRQAEYAIINDRSHDYRTMLYFTTIDNQRRQLAAAGFKPDITVFDLSGRVVNGATDDGTLTFVVGK